MKQHWGIDEIIRIGGRLPVITGEKLALIETRARVGWAEPQRASSQ